MSTDSELSNFLSILGGTGRTVTVEDIHGQSYHLSVILPAVRQLELAAAFDEALGEESLRGAFNALQAVAGDSQGDQIRGLIRGAKVILAADNRTKILSILDKLTQKAHPTVPAPACENFELQEVLKMLLPFVGRILRGVSTAVPARTSEA